MLIEAADLAANSTGSDNYIPNIQETSLSLQLCLQLILQLSEVLAKLQSLLISS